MFEVILITLLAVFFAYINRYKGFRYGLKISFIVIFIFLAIRYDFGNDYMGYYKDFIDVNTYTSINYFDIAFHYEPGWLFLCRVFKPLGFFGLVIILALFNCLVYYFFIKRYVPVKYYWLAVFLYLCDPGFMLVQASAMRQSVAIGLFLCAVPYIYKKDPIRYALCVGAAYLFHSSALILLPLFFLGFINWNINKISGTIILLIFVSLFFFGKMLLPYFNQFITSNFERYKEYQGGATVGTGFGIVYSALLFILVMYYEKYQINEIRLVFKIAIISFMFIPLSFLIQIIGRVGMYFEPTTIIVYPIILSNIKKESSKVIFITYILFITGYLFFQFFNSELYGNSFGTYHTIFSVPNKN